MSHGPTQPQEPDPRALVNRGRELERRADHAGALDAYRRAADADPDRAEAHAAVARLAERLNDLPTARAAAERALALDPGAHGARLALASVLRRSGDPAGARAHLEAVLRPGDPDRAAPLPPAALAVAWNRYALLLDALDDAEGAMDASARAHEARWSLPDGAGIDAGAPLRRARATRAFLTADRAARWADEHDRSRPDTQPHHPVVHAGFPRSGTTLTERILGAHPSAAILDERSPLREVILHARRLAPARPYPDGLDDLTPAHTRELREAYHRAAAQRADLAGRTLVDKVPLHLLDLAAIVRLFPRARIIVAVRDPRDVCVSASMQLMVPNPSMANLRTIPDAARFYAAVMGLWLDARAVIPNPWLESRYEDLTADPEPAARRLLDFAALAWDPRVLAFHEGARGAFIATPSFEAVSRPISTGAQGRWRRYARWLEPAAADLAPFLDAWGYER